MWRDPVFWLFLPLGSLMALSVLSPGMRSSAARGLIEWRERALGLATAALLVWVAARDGVLAGLVGLVLLTPVGAILVGGIERFLSRRPGG